MQTTTSYRFQEIWAYGRADIRCTVCNKHISKRVSHACTINPFNKNEAGEMCTAAEVRAQAQAHVDREVGELEAAGRVCSKCQLAQADPYQGEPLDPNVLLATIASSAKIENDIKALDRIAREQWVGRDVMHKSRKAKVQDCSFFARGVVVTFRYYSLKKTAMPGELLFDSHSVNIREIEIVE